jgi:hypothetical protein
MDFGDYDVMQLVIVVVVLEQLLALFEILDFYFVLELLHQDFSQLFEALDLIVFKEIVDFHENVLFVIFSLQKGKRGFHVAVYSMKARLQS